MLALGQGPGRAPGQTPVGRDRTLARLLLLGMALFSVGFTSMLTAGFVSGFLLPDWDPIVLIVCAVGSIVPAVALLAYVELRFYIERPEQSDRGYIRARFAARRLVNDPKTVVEALRTLGWTDRRHRIIAWCFVLVPLTLLVVNLGLSMFGELLFG
jgi:hypothetical protein